MIILNSDSGMERHESLVGEIIEYVCSANGIALL